MPIAKSSAPEETVTPVTIAPPPSGIAGYEWEGIPVDVFRQFNAEMSTIPSKDIQQLRDITQWAKEKCDDPTIGNILSKISSVQRQLGSPAINEKAYTKVWQFVKWQKVIDETRKRQDSLRGVQWVV